MITMPNMELSHPTFDRLLIAAKELKGLNSQADIARELNLPEQNITNWKSRGVPKDSIIELSDKWGFRAIWLRDGTGQMEAGNITNTTANNDLKIKQEARNLYQIHNNNANTILIKQYDAYGAMGTGLLLRDQAGIINEWNVSDEWLRLNIKTAISSKLNLKIVTGFGDSMQGDKGFNSGDPLLIDAGIKTVEFDSIYFFRVGNEGFIKRLQRIPGQGLKAISINKSYESWVITEDMEFEVLGRVLKLWQGVDF